MQVVAFECSQVFNEVFFSLKHVSTTFMAFVPFVKTLNVSTFPNCKILEFHIF
jgi:hypothetical protein